MPATLPTSLVSSILSSLETTITSTTTDDAALLPHLKSLSQILSTLPTPPPSLPYRSLRENFTRILSTPSLSPQTTLLTSSLFLHLLSHFPLSYDEFTLSTALHHVIQLLKSTISKCPNRCDPKSTLCTSSAHVPLARYTQFWNKLVHLCRSEGFDVKLSGFLTLVCNAIGEVIQHASGAWHRQVVLSVFPALLDKCDTKAHAIVYKTLFPLVRVHLPGMNRVTLVGVVEIVARREVENRRKRREGGSVGSTGEEDSSVDDGVGKMSRLPILRFLELCSVHVLDRADQRGWLCGMIVQVLKGLDEESVEGFKELMLMMSRHPKGRVRLFVVELAAKLVFVEEEEEAGVLKWMRMLGSRCNDRVPSVRVKAIMSMIEGLKKFRGTSGGGVLDKLVSVAFLLRQRLRDAKARVRKAAVDYVGLVGKLMIVQKYRGDGETSSVSAQDDGGELEGVPEKKIIELALLLKERGHDAVSNVRIATIAQATRMVLNISEWNSEQLRLELVKLWCEIVLPHITDIDARCKDACLKAIQAVFVPTQGDSRSSGNDGFWQASSCAVHHIPKLILSAMGGKDHAIADLLRNAFNIIFKNGAFGAGDVKNLCEKTKLESVPEVQRGAWIALAEVAVCGKVNLIRVHIGLDTIMREAMQSKNKSACKIAQNVVQSSKSNSKIAWATSIEEEIFAESRMQTERLDREWVPAALGLLASLRTERGNFLLGICSKLIIASSGEMALETKENLLVIIGGICLSFLLQRPPPESILLFVQATASTSTEQSRLRALALTTLGKVCLCRGAKPALGMKPTRKQMSLNKLGESLTRQNIAIFVHELDKPTSSATRNNAMLVLCDLCRVYTSVVEPYLPRLAGLLVNPSDFVRIQVISSLVGLLQEDYIKVRGGAVLYQIADCLLDPCASVRTTAEYCLLHVMSPKNASVLATSFIELIFMLNNCTECDIYKHNQIALRKRPNDTIGDDFDQRMKIYNVFLRGMTLEQRLRLPGRFRTDVIGMIVDVQLDLSKPSVQAVLRDTLRLLCCDKLRCIGVVRGVEGDGASQGEESSQMEESGTGNVQLNKKMSLLKKVQMVELRESTIPALLEIRHRLEELRSPLLKPLMLSLCTLLQPHRKDLEEIIRDGVVRAEVIHEMTNGNKKAGTKRQKKIYDGKGNEELDDRKSSIVSGESPMDVKAMSVPRTRKVRKISLGNLSESEEEDGVEEEDSEESEPLNMRIAASPKLAAIAGRGGAKRRSGAFVVNVEAKASGFAKTLRRIENESLDMEV